MLNECRGTAGLLLALITLAAGCDGEKTFIDGEHAFTLSKPFRLDTPVPASAISAWHGHPRVAFNGKTFLVAWMDGRTWPERLSAARLSPQGQVLDSSAIILADEIASLSPLTLAAAGGHFLVAYATAKGSKLIRVDDAGKRGGAEIAFCDAGGGGPCGVATVGGSSGGFLVAYTRKMSAGGWGLFVRRISAAGQLLDSEGTLISERGSCLGIGSDGSEFFVLWERPRDPKSSTSVVDLYGTRVGSSGAIQGGPGILIRSRPYSPGPEHSPGLSFDGTRYLLTWGIIGKGVFGRRVDPAAGKVLDTSDRVLHSAAGTSNLSSATASSFDGKNHLVVWTVEGAIGDPAGVYGVRVSPAGVPLDSNPLKICAAPSNNLSSAPRNPVVAFDGTEYMVVYHGYHPAVAGSGSQNLFTRRVSPSGAVASSAVAVGLAANNQLFPEVASDGAGFLAVWEDSRTVGQGEEIYARRLDSAGRPLGAAAIPVYTAPTSDQAPTVAFGGGEYLVVLSALKHNSGTITGVRLSPGGAALGKPLPLAHAYARSEVAFGPGVFLVVFHQDAGGVGAVRVAPGGKVLDSSARKIGFSQGGVELDVAGNDRGFLVAWAGWNTGNSPPVTKIRASAVTASGGSSAAVVVSSAPHPREVKRVNVASDGKGYLVIWAERIGSTTAVKARRLDASGALQGAADLTLVKPTLGLELYDVSHTGLAYLVTWSDAKTTRGTLIRSDGQVTGSLDLGPDPNPNITRYRSHSWASHAFNQNGDALLTWHLFDDQAGVRSHRVQGRILSGEVVNESEVYQRGCALSRAAPGDFPPSWPGLLLLVIAAVRSLQRRATGSSPRG